MEREISQTIEISVTMVILSALLGIVFFTVVLGNHIKTGSLDEINSVKEKTEIGFMQDMVGAETVMPTVSALNILKTYRDVIPVCVCEICGETRNLILDSPCLNEHLSGKVSIEVIPRGSTAYKVIIREVE